MKTTEYATLNKEFYQNKSFSHCTFTANCKFDNCVFRNCKFQSESFTFTMCNLISCSFDNKLTTFIRMSFTLVVLSNFVIPNARFDFKCSEISTNGRFDCNRLQVSNCVIS